MMRLCEGIPISIPEILLGLSSDLRIGLQFITCRYHVGCCTAWGDCTPCRGLDPSAGARKYLVTQSDDTSGAQEAATMRLVWQCEGIWNQTSRRIRSYNTRSLPNIKIVRGSVILSTSSRTTLPKALLIVFT